MSTTFYLRTLRRCFATILILLTAGLMHAQTIFYVKKSGGGDGNTGLSWEQAYENLNKALAAANLVPEGTAVEIRVAAGVYKPTEGLVTLPTDVRDATFGFYRGDGVGKELKVYGGYPASGGSTRDATANPVYLDGDIGSVDDVSDNCYHVGVFNGYSWSPDSLVLDGFIFRNGNANGVEDYEYNSWQKVPRSVGGGLASMGHYGLAGIIRNCVFTQNSASLAGGGVYALGDGFTLNFYNCSFLENTLTSDFAKGAGVSITFGDFESCLFKGNEIDRMFTFGGGLHLRAGNIVSCNFEQNKITGDFSGGGAIQAEYGGVLISGSSFDKNAAPSGGAINIESGATVHISATRFIENSASGLGGAINHRWSGSTTLSGCYLEKNEAAFAGGGIAVQNVSFSISESTFNENRTSENESKGGAIYLDNSQVPITNSIFYKNTAAQGASLFEDGNNFEALLSNSTFTENTATNIGGIYQNSSGGGQRKIINSVFWRNSGGELFESSPGYLIVENSIVQGGYSGTGNLDTDPFFRNASDPDGPDNIWGTADDGLQLLVCSPAVDAGIGTDAPPNDILGRPRVNGNNQGGAEPDMGAYESQVVQSPPFGVIYGTTEICPGTSTDLNVSLTNGYSPFKVVYRDGINNFTVDNYISGVPITVSPSATTTYTLVSITDAEQCVATSMTGAAEITVLTTPAFSLVPSDQNVSTDPGQCSAIVNYAATTTGSNTALHPLNVSYVFSGATVGSGSGIGSGVAFQKGETTVTLTASNGCLPDAVRSFKVIVTDNENPTISASASISTTTSADGTGNCTAAVAVPDAVFADNCPAPVLSWVLSGATTGSGSGQVGTRTFEKGVTTIAYTVTDAAGNVATGTLTVTVTDDEAPSIAAASDISTATSADGTGNCTVAVAVPDATFADNCPAPVLSWVLTGATTGGGTGQVGTRIFEIGITTVTYTVTDAAGNTKTSSLNVTVADNENPAISVNPALTAFTNSGCTATGVVLGTPVTSDNCSVVSVTNNAPTTFSLGTTTVTWTVTDGSGNTATATQMVTVTDNVNPAITAPAAVSTTINSGCTATGVVLGTPVATDNCSVASVVNDAPSAFPLGTTTVTWTVTDGSGNTATATQTVTVTDHINPTITAPAAVSATTNTACTATGVNLGTPVTADNCSVASVTNNAPSIFPLGATTVTWTVTDGSGNTATATQTVTVTDNINPTITAPAAISATTNTACTATGVNLGTPATADNCSVASVTNNAPTTFSLGTTTVTWTVTDGSGNTATATQMVTVTDNVNPTITAPAAVSAIINSGCTATGVVLGTPVATDNCSVASVVNDAPSAFPLGVTTVTWTVTDGSGNTATATQTVTITDNINPTITAPAAVSATTNTACTATGVNLGTPVTADNCSVASVTNNAPSAFLLGTTTVTWTVTDASGNTATAVQTVNVTDNQKPVKPVLASVTGECSVTLTAPTTTDNCAGTITGTTSDPLTYNTLGTYVVTWTFDDLNGNIETAEQTVVVEVTDLAPNLATQFVNMEPGENTILAFGQCKLIARIIPGTAGGYVTCTTYVEAAVQTFVEKPYVQRHYSISPATNGSGRVTLFYRQEEFDAYNAHPGSTLNLPSGPEDVTGIANLRINQFHGQSDNPATGRPGTYSGNAELLDPSDADIIWDSENEWWSVSFSVAGFSGFFVTAGDDSALPVSLSSFEVSQGEQNSALLAWTTVEEVNSSHFEIERSADALLWEKIGRVQATSAGNYSFTDYLSESGASFSGIRYYRLKMVDLDKSYEYSPVRSLKLTAKPFDVTLYPNPASEYFVIKSNGAGDLKSVTVFNLIGQEVLETKDVRANRLEIGSLPAGVYQVKVVDVNGRVLFKKLVIGK